MKKIFFALTVLLLTACGPKKDVKIAIIPKPLKTEIGSGSFSITGNTAIVCKTDEEKKIGQFIIDALKKFNNISLAVKKAENDAIVLSLNDTIKSLGDEGYKMIVSKDKIEICAGKPAGLFYGVQSLIQLCGTKETVAIPCITIEDMPAFKWRGLMLDEESHFCGKEFLFKLFDQMSAIKMNIFHWHIADDEGWRIDIKKYPKLTEIGAWRKGDGRCRKYYPEPAEEGSPRYGGFYTQKEIKEIIAYAAERYITIVPEIEMPGHSAAAIYSYPELSCKGKLWKPDSSQAYEFSDPLCAGNEKVFEVYEDILSEVVELFPSEYIHIGGDECKKDPWKVCPKCQKRMKAEKLNTVEELQSYFIKRIEKVIVSKGKKLIGWDEIMEGGLAPEATVMSWRGVTGGIAAANEGHDVVMSPTDFCYFDYYQGNSMNEPKAFGGYLPLRKVYSFNPIPEELTADKHHLILGGQGNVWTGFMFSTDYIEYMIFPRIFAMAEVLWTPKEKQDYENFLYRLPNRINNLIANGINFRMPSVEGLEQMLLIPSDTTIGINNPMETEGVILYYTTNGADPDQKSAVYKNPIHIKSTTCLKARLFLGEKSSSVSQSWYFIYNPEVNGLNCEFFKGSWSMLPNFDSLTSVKSYIVPNISGNTPDTSVDDYALRLKASYQVDNSKEYTFYTCSDDGSKLFIDGKQILDNDSCHDASLVVTGKAQLEKGMHKIEILFFEGKGEQYLEAGTLNEKGEKQPFDPGKLFFKK